MKKRLIGVTKPLKSIPMQLSHTLIINYLVNLGKSKEALECCSKASELNVPQNPVYESIILTNKSAR